MNAVKETKRLLKSDVYLVLGGFHLSGMGAFQINDTIKEIKNEGVRVVAPCHCSGGLARSLFKKACGEDVILVGVSKRLEIRAGVAA